MPESGARARLVVILIRAVGWRQERNLAAPGHPAADRFEIGRPSVSTASLCASATR